MSENTLYIVPIDRDYQPSEQQKEQALAYFEEIISEAEHFPCLLENPNFYSDDDEQVEAKIALTAGEIYGTEEFWLIDDEFKEDESFEDYKDEDGVFNVMYDSQLQPDIHKKLEELTGTKLELFWVRG